MINWKWCENTGKKSHTQHAEKRIPNGFWKSFTIFVRSHQSGAHLRAVPHSQHELYVVCYLVIGYYGAKMSTRHHIKTGLFHVVFNWCWELLCCKPQTFNFSFSIWFCILILSFFSSIRLVSITSSPVLNDSDISFFLLLLFLLHFSTR